ncbi:MAG: DUF6165 family protein [Rhodospirillales bacterium]
MTEPLSIKADIAPGELIDKITILEIKSERLSGVEKLENVRRELAALTAARGAAVRPSEQLDALAAALKAVNETLWDIEDNIRAHEREKDFGDGFIKLARAVYHENDKRAALKREINELLGAAFSEEKSYTAY